MTTVSSPSAAPASHERVDPADRVGRWRDRSTSFAREQRPSLIVGGAVLLFFTVVAVRMPWADDLMLHIAVLRRLMLDPLHPGNPVIAVGGSSIYYSPFMVVLALLGKLFGLSAYTMLKLAAVVNITLLATGVYRFVRSLSQARWAPPLAMVGLLFWWGTKVIAFSGFLSLISVGDTEAYPSTLATALTLHVWAWLNDGGRTLRSPRRAIGIGVLFGLILLIHQFTGLSAIVGAAAILVSQHRIVRTKAVAVSLVVGLVACAVIVAVWPYYHLWSVNQGELDALDPIHRALYAEVVTWYGMGFVLGLVALGLRWRRNRMDLLALMFVGLGIVVAYGKVTEHWSYGRSWPMLMLVAQVAVAIALAEAESVRARWSWGVPVALATVVGGWTQFSGGFENLPHLDTLDKYFTSNTVVAASAQDAMYEAAGHGSYNVTAPWYLPEIPRSVQNQRNAAVKTIFAAHTPAATRMSLLAKYDVTWVLLEPHQPLPRGLSARLTAHESGYRLYQVIYTH